jgi:hypothetical protein
MRYSPVRVVLAALSPLIKRCRSRWGRCPARGTPFPDFRQKLALFHILPHIDHIVNILQNSLLILLNNRLELFVRARQCRLSTSFNI